MCGTKVCGHWVWDGRWVALEVGGRKAGTSQEGECSWGGVRSE